MTHRRGIKSSGALWSSLLVPHEFLYCDKWYASFAIVFMHNMCIFFHPIIIISDRPIHVCAVSSLLSAHNHIVFAQRAMTREYFYYFHKKNTPHHARCSFKMLTSLIISKLLAVAHFVRFNFQVHCMYVSALRIGQKIMHRKANK